MSRFIPLLSLLALAQAQAGPNDPLMFELRPLEHHAYQNGPLPPLTLTLHLQNSTAKPVTLKCLSVGTPILKKWTAFQD